jgi:hypothetical protein
MRSDRVLICPVAWWIYPNYRGPVFRLEPVAGGSISSCTDWIHGHSEWRAEVSLHTIDVQENAIDLVYRPLQEEEEMTVWISHYPEEDRLDLTIAGNLDSTLAQQILQACEYVDDHLSTCVIDTTRVEKAFDSGLVLLMLLVSKLVSFQIRLVVLLLLLVSKLVSFQIRLVVVDDLARLGLDVLPLEDAEFKPMCARG